MYICCTISIQFVHGRKRNIWRPGKAQAGTRDNEAKIWDVPGNTGRLATLGLGDRSLIVGSRGKAPIGDLGTSKSTGS